MIELSKDSVETNLRLFVDKLLSLPEVKYLKIKKLEICRDNRNEMIKSAVDKSYHDYEPRSKDFFAIWKSYEEYRLD